MRTRPTVLLAVVLGLSPLLAGCGGADTTEEEFLDHAMELSTAATSPEQQESLRRIYECVWPELSRDEDLLGDFMDSEEPSDDVSTRISRLMGDCITAGQATGESATSTTAGTSTSTTTVGEDGG